MFPPIGVSEDSDPDGPELSIPLYYFYIRLLWFWYFVRYLRAPRPFIFAVISDRRRLSAARAPRRRNDQALRFRSADGLVSTEAPYCAVIRPPAMGGSSAANAR